MKPSIALDTDGVLINFTHAMRDRIDPFREKNLPEPHEFYFEAEWNIDSKQFRHYVHEAVEMTCADPMRYLYPDVIESVILLARKYRVHVVTARHPIHIYPLLAKVPLLGSKVYSVHTTADGGPTKGEICAMISAQYILEDAVHNLDEIRDYLPGCTVPICRTQSWNTGRWSGLRADSISEFTKSVL